MQNKKKTLFRAALAAVYFLIITTVCLLPVFAADEPVVYVSDGASGNGADADNACGSFDDAIAKLPNGGTVVIVGRCTVRRSTVLKTNGTVRFTSVHNGIDYRQTRNAALSLSGDFLCYNETVFDGLNVMASAQNAAIVFNGRRAVVGEDVTGSLSKGVDTYVSLIAGSKTAADNIKSTSLTVSGGIWNSVFGGNTMRGSSEGNTYSLTINGGTFHGRVAAVGEGAHKGTATLTINGGTFYKGVYAYDTADDSVCNCDVNIILNDGAFYGRIGPAFSYRIGVYGNYTVTVNGGDYAHLTDLEGDKKYSGRAQTNLIIGENMDVSEEVKGEFTYTNPLKKTADPRILLVDGVYYYVATDTSVLHVYKANNIPDLAYAEGVIVWNTALAATAMENRTSNIWPCSLEYFSPEDFGSEYAGYYITFSTANYYDEQGNVIKYYDSNRRTYILKSASSDLQGDWVNPVTGEKNVPIRFSSDTESWVNRDNWCCGYNKFKYNGKCYALYTEQRDMATINFRQVVYLAELKNPWTVTGTSIALIEPKYDWEKHVNNFGALAGTNSAYDTKTDIWYLGVIEGVQPVFGKNGELYILYVGSGYWTVYYAFGSMKYIGTDSNLLDINNWQRSSTPIFSRNSEVNGTGGPTLVTTPDGKTDLIMYHVYLGADTSSGRYAFLEPYTIDESGIHWGVDGHPSPISTEFTLPLNATPLFKKIAGFDNFKVDFLYLNGAASMTLGTTEKELAAALNLSVYGGKKYDDSYGTLSFSYSEDGISFIKGLPQQAGEYTVRAVLSGNYAYAKLGGTFPITVTPSPEAPAEESGNSSPVWVFIASGALLLFVVVIILIRFKKKLK